MKTLKLRPIVWLITVYMTVFGGIWCGGASQAVGKSSNKPLREAKVRKLREESKQRKFEAELWAIKHNRRIRYEVNGVLKELMRIENGRPIYEKTMNDDAVISTAADQIRKTAPYNLDGSGVAVGVWDGGLVRKTHQEFGIRCTLLDAGASHYHPTHVAGTIGASGIVARAEGMAPAAWIDSYDWTDDGSEMANVAAAAPVEPGTIHISNHSYGWAVGWEDDNASGNWGWHWSNPLAIKEEPYFGMYHIEPQQWDEICYDNPYFLPVKAAGNARNDGPVNGDTIYYYTNGWHSIIYNDSKHPLGDGIYKGGYDCLAPKATAKNILTVGAVDDAVSGGIRWLANATMADFSSWGPTDDGRIKPDVVGNGIDLYSTDDGNDSDYRTISGTSMSSPNVCGSAALLIQLYKKRHGPGNAPRSATLRGLIIHTADDLGTPGPDYSYGWGLMNTKTAADIIKKDASASDETADIRQNSLSPADTFDEYDYEIDGLEDFKVTLCWTDPPGPISTSHDDFSKKLVNDLNLRVIGPGGSPTNFPYVLFWNNPTRIAARGINTRDNVEQIYKIAGAASPGTYTVRVDYDGTLSNGAQMYSLIVSGTIPEPSLALAQAAMLVWLLIFGKRYAGR